MSASQLHDYRRIAEKSVCAAQVVRRRRTSNESRSNVAIGHGGERAADSDDIVKKKNLYTIYGFARSDRL